MKQQFVRVALACAAAGVTTLSTYAQQAPEQSNLQRPPNVERTFSDPSAYIPDLTNLAAATSELRDTVERFSADRAAIQRFYTIPGSPERRERLRAFYAAWLKALTSVDFDKFSRDGQVDYVLLRNYIEYQVALLGREERAERRDVPAAAVRGRSRSSCRKSGRSCTSSRPTRQWPRWPPSPPR